MTDELSVLTSVQTVNRDFILTDLVLISGVLLSAALVGATLDV